METGETVQDILLDIDSLLLKAYLVLPVYWRTENSYVRNVWNAGVDTRPRLRHRVRRASTSCRGKPVLICNWLVHLVHAINFDRSVFTKIASFKMKQM